MARVNYSRITAALSITLLIFFSGFVGGYFLTSGKVSQLTELQNEIYTQSLSLDALFDLASENLCDAKGLIPINNQLNELGNKLTIIEEDTSRSLEAQLLAEQYIALEVKHFLLINEINQECGKQYSTILYFFSPDRTECSNCAAQGALLTEVKSSTPELMIYSFNWNVDSPVIDRLLLDYDIDTIPTLVINGKKFEGILGTQEIINNS
jgi:hypothetical protein|tara:strand:- start:149 stop:775 length:627 start_codon:yes stop_codon:yes gene_type:complete